MVAELSVSLVLTIIFRLSGVLGSFTTSEWPRIVWSAARAVGAAVTARVSTRATRVVRLRNMGWAVLRTVEVFHGQANFWMRWLLVSAT
jgi:hypothetical protein